MRKLELSATRLALLSFLMLGVSGSRSDAQTATGLSGSYGFLMNQTFANSDGQKGLGFLGILNFEAGGQLTASIVYQNGAGPRHASETGTLPGSGAYTVNPDGTGTLRLEAAELTLTFAMVAAEGGQSLQLLLVKCASGPDDCGADPVVITGTARALKGGAKTLKGTYAFTSGSSPLPGSAIGLLTFDGAGGVTESFTALSIGERSAGVAGTASASSGSLAGTYTIKPNGNEGTLTLQVDPSLKLNVSFVITDGGSGLLFLVNESDTSNRNLTFGSARLQ